MATTFEVNASGHTMLVKNDDGTTTEPQWRQGLVQVLLPFPTVHKAFQANTKIPPIRRPSLDDWIRKPQDAIKADAELGIEAQPAIAGVKRFPVDDDGNLRSSSIDRLDKAELLADKLEKDLELEIAHAMTAIMRTISPSIQSDVKLHDDAVGTGFTSLLNSNDPSY